MTFTRTEINRAITYVLSSSIVGAGAALAMWLLNAPGWAVFAAFIAVVLLIAIPLQVAYQLKFLLEHDEIDLVNLVSLDASDSAGLVEVHVRLKGEQPWGVMMPVHADGVRQRQLLAAIEAAARSAEVEAGGRDA